MLKQGIRYDEDFKRESVVIYQNGRFRVPLKNETACTKLHS